MIAIYTRKSKFTGKGESIENQIIKCKQFVNFKFDNIKDENIKIFIDEGYSGKNENRPEYQNMIQQVKEKKINKIVIYQLNRLGRNSRDIHNTMQLCTDLNCIIYSAIEGFDSGSSFGRAVIGILASLAQLEREQIAERVKDNMYTLARLGRWLGGTAPLGFTGSREIYFDESGKKRTVTKLIPDASEQKTVKLIYDLYIKYKSLTKVARYLQENNIKGKNGGYISAASLNIILTNCTYVKCTDAVIEYFINKKYEVCGNTPEKGFLKHGNIIAVAKHCGIIDGNTWLQVQELLKKNSDKAPRTGTGKTGLLSGLLKCYCGSNMAISYRSGIHKNEYDYICSKKTRLGKDACKSKNVKGNILEQKIIESLKCYSKQDLVKNLRLMLQQENAIQQESSINKIDKKIKELLEKKKNLLANLEKELSDEIILYINKKVSEINAEIKELKKEREAKMDAVADAVISNIEIQRITEKLDNFNTVFDAADLQGKRELLNEVIEKIQYKEDKSFAIVFKKKISCSFVHSAIADKNKLQILEVNNADKYAAQFKKIEIKTFADAVKAKRLQLKLTDAKFAELIGINTGLLYQIKNSTDNLNITTLNKFVDALGIEILNYSDYYKFIYNQKENFNILLQSFSKKELMEITGKSRNTIKRWITGENIIIRQDYIKIISLYNKRTGK